MLLENERQAVIDYSRRMRADGLVVGTSGNVSVCVRDLIVVTPSGIDYEQLTPAVMAVVHRLDGAPVDAPLPPTSELAMHLSIYATTDAMAVVHTHSPAATAVSTLVDELPSLHYLVGLFGGPIRVAPYATYGTPELAVNMAMALDGRTGCLLANHGTITIGETLKEAYQRAEYLEWLCDVWLRASAVRKPRLLDDEEIDRVTEKLARYGTFAAMPDAAATPETPLRSRSPGRRGSRRMPD